ncbi:DMT family transporter [Mycolicibacter kumamotonensis]|uniref:DMT family transporter n=1 Tax=Mycolicibacter kumamotonensis TaxID=354243 RepID=UPI001A99BA65|nr:DMT family transporter [Mycolicibacter kumamotonensis]
MIGSPAAQGLALASATSFGISDFVGGVASRRVAALRVVLVSTPVSMVMLGVLALICGGHVTTAAVVLGVLGGLSQLLGIWWFYAAMAVGPISVVSPLAAVVDAGVPVCFGRVLGERPGMLASVGIAVALAAVVLISWHAGDGGFRPGLTGGAIWLTIGSGVALGLNFVFLDRTPPDAGLWPLLFARGAATALVIVVAAASRNLRAPTGNPLRLALVIALLDTAGNVTMLFALQLSLLSLASVLISLYPAATVVLAVTVLRERVRPRQVAGMVLAAVAVALITG